MAKYQILTATGFMLLTQTCFAQTYQAEIDLEYAALGSNSGFNGDANYYFTPIDQRKGPISESAFLAGVNSVAYRYREMSGRSSETVVHNLEGTFYFHEGKVFVSGNLTRIEYSEFDYSESDNEYGAVVGVKPLPGLSISTRFKTSPIEWLPQLTETFSYPSNDFYNPNLALKYVTQLDGGSAVNLEAFVSNGDYDMSYVGADYFVDPSLSFGVWYEELFRTNGYGIQVEKYFRNGISVSSSYFEINASDIWTLKLGYRFLR